MRTPFLGSSQGLIPGLATLVAPNILCSKACDLMLDLEALTLVALTPLVASTLGLVHVGSSC
jgi:hypothetical protein